MAPRNYSHISYCLSVSQNGNQFTKPHSHARNGVALIAPSVLSSLLGLGLGLGLALVLASSKEHPQRAHGSRALLLARADALWQSSLVPGARLGSRIGCLFLFVSLLLSA